MKPREALVLIPFILGFLCAWGPCQPKPVQPPVAPVGPVPNVATVPVTNDLTTQTADQAAKKAVLSKVSASAGAIDTINQGQPPGPRTDGVKGETVLIKTLTGPPTTEDQLAAEQRARIVAEGKADEIAKAYHQAQSDADAQKSRADKAESDLKTANDDLAKVPDRIAAAIKDAQAEAQKKSDAAFAQVKADADRRVAEANSATRKLQLAIFFGFGALLFAVGVVVLLTAAQVPMFGPKAGFGLMGAGAGLIAIGVVVSEVQNFIDQHPWIIGAGLGLVGALVVAAAALMFANHHHHLASLSASPATATPAKTS